MANYSLNEWASVEDYLVRVEEIKEEMVLDGGLRRKEKVRSVRILVAYKNKTSLTTKHLCLQWLLYDTDGYNYDSEITRHFYGDDSPRKLQEAYLGLGKQAKGWVAFKVPKDAVLDYVQFRPNYMSHNIALISLEKSAASVANAPEPTSDNLLKKAWQKITSTSSATTLADLQENDVYRCKKPIFDFYGNVFSPGDHLAYERRYPPYHGLHTFVFTEATLYLHEDEHADILREWNRFFELTSE